MTKPSVSTSVRAGSAQSSNHRSITTTRPGRKRARKTSEKSDVLISAVVSTYLLTHLHHVLQRAEYGAAKEGREAQAANFAQLRKVLCMDARSMADASADGVRERTLDQLNHREVEAKAA